MKGKKTGGRQKGSKNKVVNAEDIAAKYKLHPFDVLLMIANNDWRGLGYDKPTTTKASGAGATYEDDLIKIPDRNKAAAEATKYLFATKKDLNIDIDQIHNMPEDEFQAFKAQLLKEAANDK